ncbi:hypothetical protein DID88_000311 [Monilinia fructigena]|uniref:Uncharacterized protein n=1 Tax=Monilinia fructigena TaxID=38457 RepID=A0A395IJM5_9HELO|nr:hypothetical protein DID88_000311 [Monilinia fructigena]
MASSSNPYQHYNQPAVEEHDLIDPDDATLDDLDDPLTDTTSRTPLTGTIQPSQPSTSQNYLTSRIQAKTAAPQPTRLTKRSGKPSRGTSSPSGRKCARCSTPNTFPRERDAGGAGGVAGHDWQGDGCGGVGAGEREWDERGAAGLGSVGAVGFLLGVGVVVELSREGGPDELSCWGGIFHLPNPFA